MSMNDKNRHVSVPQPLIANFGPPVPPVGPGPGQGPIVGQQPWMPNNGHPLPYHMPGQGYPAAYKNSAIRAPEFPPGMHPAGYMPRYPSYDTQCQSFPFGKIHEGPGGRPPNPNAYPIVRHYNSQHYNEIAKEPNNKNSLDLFPQSKSPGQAKEKSNREKNGNGRDELMSSPSEGKSDSETNHTTTESCPDDTRSPTSLDKHDNNFFGDKSENSMKSISDSNSHPESDPKKAKNNNHNNIDSNSEQDSQTFSSISNSNNAKKDVLHAPYEMRIHRQFNPHGDSMYGMFPDDDRRHHNSNNNPMMGHHMNEPMHFGYRGAGRDMDKLGDMDATNSSENVFQVPSISSTTPPKIFPPIPPSPMSEPWDDAKYYQQQGDDDSDKLPRKKRKRCGECPGCLQKQNCGRCGPCRSVRSHQICKMRKCESLKTKKERAAEDAVKSGRKGKELLNASIERSASENSGKMNGNPQSYLSQTDSLSPTNSNSMQVGSQGMRNHMDQYQPQGGNDFHPQGMMNSYNPNAQYGSFSPQVPPPHNPHIQPMFDSRVGMPMVEGPVDMDNHRITNHRLKSLIHNRQNQREHGQLIPISNPTHDSSFNSMPLSPINHYAPSYTNHQDSMMRNSSTPYSGPPDTSTSSLMHLQQLSPNSISPQKSWAEASRKTPESSPTVLQVQKSPAKVSVPVQNGHADMPPSEELPKMVNGIEKPDKVSNGSLDVNSERIVIDPLIKEDVKIEAKAPPPPVLELKAPTPEPTTGRVSTPMQPPPTSPRFNSSFTPPGYAYRSHQPLTPIQQGCMPPPPPMPITNGIPNHSLHPTDANCDEPTQSPPFLLNTTTSMNTYINITNTYKNSKLSFSNATCLPTYAPTSVSSSSQTYSGSQHFYNSQQQHMHFNSYHQEGNINNHLLPKGGGTISKSYIDSGRIQSLDSFQRPDIPHNYGHCEALPLQPNYYPSSFPPAPPIPVNYPPFNNSNCSTPVCVDSQDVDPMERIEKLRTNTKLDPPQCDCLKNKEVMSSEKLPYYTQLGSGSSVSAIRELMECRSGEKGNAIRIEKLLYSGKEGKTSQGCPLTKWIIRRSGPEEKLLTVIRHRAGHTCPTAYIIIAMVAWEGVTEDVADVLYKTVVYKTVNFGIPTQRKCGTNEMRTCACQGLDPEICGASFSFGCSWSMYYNGCKFARSKNARKFKLTEKDEEKELEERLQTLATDVAHLYKRMAPESFYNQTEFEQQASDCRLGNKKGRPFSGVTACIDYCAHSHKDLQNMNNGCTVVVTLNKHKGWEKPEDEQLHVLPLYVMDSTDEHGSKEGQDKKVASRALEVLEKYPVDYRIRTTPLKPCKTRGRKPKDGYSPRKQALQAAFKQLIASGKLRRIDPLDLYPKCNNTLPLINNTQPDSGANSHNILQSNNNNNMQSFKGDETACKFYAGKHIAHYANHMHDHGTQGWLPTSQSVNNSHNSTSMGDRLQFHSSVASYDSRALQASSSNHSFSNTCSKVTSVTDLTSSCNSYNNDDRNNNYIPPVGSQHLPSSHPSFRTVNSPNYPHFYNSNFLPHTFRPPNPYSSYQTSHNYYENHPMYHSRYPYGYSEPNVPLKIPGNYSASSNYPANSENYQNVSYSSNSLGTLNNFCNYTMQKASQHNVPESFMGPDNDNNFVGFNPNIHTKDSSTQDQGAFINQNIFVKSEVSTFNDTQNNIQSDSPYALHDLDSKSVSCFSKTNKQPLLPAITIKEEKPSTNTNTVSNTKYYANNSTVKYSPGDYNGNSKNYNYHLQQSSLGLAYSSPPNYNTGTHNTEYAFKEGYESEVKNDNTYAQKGMPIDNNDLTSLSKISEGPWNGKNKYPEANHLGILASKYSLVTVEEEENFIDSTTLEGDEVYEGHSDNESSFKDPEVGGVAIALTHGSVLFECAKHEMHSTTAVKKPDRRNPTRISLVFYQHKHLNFENHGEAEWDLKMKEKRVSNMKNVDMGFEVSPNKKQCFQNDIPNANEGNPMANSNWMTVFAMPPLAVGAPFRP